LFGVVVGMENKSREDGVVLYLRRAESRERITVVRNNGRSP